MRRFQNQATEGVQIENIGDTRTGFQIAGPKAREVLQTATRHDVSALKFLDVTYMNVGMVPTIVQRVGYTGDLGYDIYCSPMTRRHLWNVLWEAGQAHGTKPFGMLATMTLRLDRFFGSWLREFSPDYTAAETGLDRFVSLKKNVDSIGRSAAEAERGTPPSRRLVTYEVRCL